MVFSPIWRRSRWTIGPYGVSTVRPFSSSFTKACDSRSRGPSSMLRKHRLRLRLAQVVILQVAVAVLVDQEPALGPRRFSDEDSCKRQTGGMVLDELHVLERRACPVRQCHPVAVLDGRVGREGEDTAAAARAQDDCPGRDGFDLSRHQFDGDHALHAAIVDEQLRHEPFVVPNDAGVFEGRLEERVQHVEAGLVGGKPRAHLFHAAERAHADAAVRLAAPGTAPVLQPKQLLGRFVDEGLHRVLIAQPIAARDGVGTACSSRLSSAPMTPAAPPSADTV